ncbi:MAG: hypothetical protein GX234_02400 [Clostridiales bacterium]|nr:hypothetical protein [Clostridiales bacterium]
MKKFFSTFLRCGLTGWCMEIIFTSLLCLRRRDMRLMGTTSLWMFPIYGLACLLSPICRLLKNRPVFLRGSIYTALIFTTEYYTGKSLQKKELCPWDYGHSRFHIKKVIRLDYAPLWFLAGLLFEHILLPSDHPAHQKQIHNP